MALKRGQRTGGGFVDLKELAKDGPVVVVFGIREFHPAEPGKFGPILPVTADLLVIDGDHGGKVILGQRYQGAISSILRGVSNPKKGEPIPEPTEEIGNDVAVVLRVINEGQPNAAAVGDEPTESTMNAIAASDHFDAEGNCLAWARAEAEADEIVGASAAAAATPAATNGAAPTAKKRPW